MKTVSRENKKTVSNRHENVVFSRNENTAPSDSFKIVTSDIHKTVFSSNYEVFCENDIIVSTNKKMKASRNKQERISWQNLNSADSLYEDSESRDLQNADHSDNGIVTPSQNEVSSNNILGNNVKVLEKLYVRNDVQDDGNCLFRCFSKCLYGHQERHFEIRTKIVNYVVNNWSIEGDKYFYKNAEQYINYMGTTSTYGTEFEISIFVKIFKVHVHLCQLKDEAMLNKERMTHFTSDDFTDILLACFDEDVIEKKSFYILFSGPLSGGHFQILEETILPCRRTKLLTETNDEVLLIRANKNCEINYKCKTTSNKVTKKKQCKQKEKSQLVRQGNIIRG